MSVIPALGKQRLEDQKFEVILSYILGSRPAWPTLDPFSKKEKKNLKRKIHKNTKQWLLLFLQNFIFENIF